MIKFLNKINKLIFFLLNKRTYGFISISKVVNKNDFKLSEKLINENEENIVDLFEEKFANMIGNGFAKSYSAGRMGFYELMKVLKIGNGDEIIVNSGNCAVMINAILNKGARAVYSDVDINTFGSCPIEIEKKISSKTKMIVAQHSFGIPCKIDRIKEIANKHGIFLLEDCALTLESKFKKIKVGNYGDAALFSFDHTKPLNGFSGGAIYTKDKLLYKKLQLAHQDMESLSKNKQKAMLKRHFLEQRLISSNNYKQIKIFDLINSLRLRLGFISPYLNENSGIDNTNCSYPYPSKMPAFTANILNNHINKTWNKLKKLRKKNLEILINELKSTKLGDFIPKIYFDQNNEIVPLRLILYNKEANYDLKKIFYKLINLDEIWFQTPIVSTNLSSSDFGLSEKELPKSIDLGNHIINLPLDINKKDLNKLIIRLKKLINSNAHLIS
jgi:perosamine synthetase